MKASKNSFYFSLILLCLVLSFPAHSQLQLFKDNKTCLYGYTDNAGKWIVPAQYVYAEEFYDRKYVVVGNFDKKGLLDTTGKLAVPLMYDQISNYSNWFYLKKDSSFSVFDAKTGRICYANFPFPIISYQQRYAIFQHGVYYGLAVNEKIVIDSVSAIYENQYTKLAIIRYGLLDMYSFRLYDTKKSIFINSEFYQSIVQQDETHYAVKKENRYGMIDNNGKTVVPFSYTALYKDPNSSNSPLILQRKNNRGYDVYSRSGEKVNRKPYPFIDTLLIKESIFIIAEKNKYGMLKYDGTLSLPCIYDSIVHLYYESGNMLLYQNKGIQVANTEGTILNTGYYSNICFTRPLFNEEGYTDSYELHLPFVVDIRADSTPLLLDLSEMTEYASGSGYQMDTGLRLYADGRYGFISADLEYVIPPVYDMIFPFEPGQQYTSVIQQERFGIMNQSGELIMKPEYVFIEQNPFSEQSFIFMTENHLFGIKNSEGDTLIQPVYTALSGYDPENDYVWAQHADSTALRLIDGNESLKSLYDFEYPFLLSDQKNVIARVNISEDDEMYKTGVLDCNTLQAVVPFIYETIAAINDSMYFCLIQKSYTDSAYSDLYIHDVRIDSVTGFTMLSENIVAIERTYSWGYFKDGKWLIPPYKKPAGYSEDERTILQIQSQTFTGLVASPDEEYEIILEFDSMAAANPLQHLLHNEVLLWYSNDQKRTFNTIFIEDEELKMIPVLYTADYVNSRINSEYEESDDAYYGYSRWNSSTIKTITAIIHTPSFAEFRYVSTVSTRSSYDIIHENKYFTLSQNNQLKELSLADITNHLQYRSLLSALINIQLDSMENIQLPCTDRDNIIDLATGYQFEKEGLLFYFKDERADESYDYEEIEVLLSYAELIPYFRKSVYLPDLYRNSLKQ